MDWIPVNEKRPEDCGSYLVVIEWHEKGEIDPRLKRRVDIAWFGLEFNFPKRKWDYSGPVPWRHEAVITHWQPLPKLPQRRLTHTAPDEKPAAIKTALSGRSVLSCLVGLFSAFRR